MTVTMCGGYVVAIYVPHVVVINLVVESFVEIVIGLMSVSNSMLNGAYFFSYGIRRIPTERFTKFKFR